MPSTDFNSKTLGQTIHFLIFRLINFYKLVKRIWDKPCWCDASSFGIILVTLVGSWARLDNRDELRWKLHCLGRLTVAHHCLKLGWWVDGVLNQIPTPNSHAACLGHCWRIWNWRGQKVRALASMSSFSYPETGEYDQDHPCSLEKAALVHSFGHFGNRYWHGIPLPARFLIARAKRSSSVLRLRLHTLWRTGCLFAPMLPNKSWILVIHWQLNWDCTWNWWPSSLWRIKRGPAGGVWQSASCRLKRLGKKCVRR